MAVGKRDGIRPADVVGSIANEAGIEGREIGPIDIRDEITYVSIPARYRDEVIEKLGHARFRGRAVQLRVAAAERAERPSYDRPQRDDRPRYDKPAPRRQDGPRFERPQRRDDRPRFDKPAHRGDRTPYDKPAPRGARTPYDKPPRRDDRPRFDKPAPRGGREERPRFFPKGKPPRRK